MLFFTIWILCTAFVAFIGTMLNHKAWKLFLISLVLSPPVGLIVILFSGNNGKQCPKCAEKVKLEALLCKHCGHDFSIVTEEQRLKKLEDESGKLKLFG